jgi:plastocyanin
MRKGARNVLIIAAAVICLTAVCEARPGVRKSAAARSGQAVAAANKVTVKISNFQFEPKSLTIKAGTTVEWVNEAGRHTVESDTGAFKSDVLTAGGRFEFKFTKPGTYAYHCGFHGEKGGKDMAGKIIVQRASK